MLATKWSLYDISPEETQHTVSKAKHDSVPQTAELKKKKKCHIITTENAFTRAV